MGRAAPALLGLCAALLACTTIRPPGPAPEPPDAGGPFSHALFERVLARFVDERGRVDYAALSRDRGDFDRYYALVAEVGPDTHPARFPSAAHRLAYWINAYNAAVLGAVLAYYPLVRVTDVGPPRLLFFLPREAGFFVFQRVRISGDWMSLYHLENGIVRKRFADPRIHFALNCASASCPRLPRIPFLPERLEQQLDREARRFVAEERNVRVDLARRRVELSRIFEWYEGDFLRWQEARGASPSLLGYLEPLLPAAKRRALERCVDCRLEFLPYDWRLNDPAGEAGDGPA